MFLALLAPNSSQAERTVVRAGSFMTTCHGCPSVIQFGNAAIMLTQLKPCALR